MQLFDKIDEDNFILYAAKNYYSPRCIDAEEFYDDINRFKYIKRLVNRYDRGGDLRVNLVLNHMTVIMNVFGYEAGLKMLEFKVGLREWSVIKPFLVYLKAIKEDQYTDVSMDDYVVDQLRKI
jgi:hypothetical protein